VHIMCVSNFPHSNDIVDSRSNNANIQYIPYSMLIHRFYGAESFNGDLSGWVVSSVEDMGGM